MNDLVRNMVRIVGAPLHEAVRMASLTPAKAIGIDHTTGAIAQDLKADLLVLDENLEVKLAFINGQRRL
jgi:N-acetylglucosamine-6-phosphate deacetylase